MTPFRNDDANPWSRETLWPRLPQTPMKPGVWSPSPRSAPEAVLPQDPQPQALAAPSDTPRPVPPGRGRRKLRRAPLIGAAAVGAAGLVTLFLLIGVPPHP